MGIVRFVLLGFCVVSWGCSGDAVGVDSGESVTSGVVVTVGVYQEDDAGGYVEAGVDDLVFAVGVPCQVWSRTAGSHDAMQNLEAVEGSHDHFNAGDAVTWEDRVLSWDEYGPEHAEADVDAVCASGQGGVTKEVTEDDYVEDKPGIFLRIKDVTGE